MLVEVLLSTLELVVLLSKLEFTTVALLSFEIEVGKLPGTTIAEATSGKVDMEAHNAIRMDESVEGFFMTDDDGRGSRFPSEGRIDDLTGG
jgi:hypothetical protein